MSKPRFCRECIHFRVPMFGPERCAAMRLSWVRPEDPRELYPCAAINVDGRCEMWDDGKPRQRNLFKEK